jgi:hypothetical protein
MKRLFVIMLFLSVASSAAEEKLDFLKEGLRGVAQYYSETPFRGRARLQWSASPDEGWHAPKMFNSMASTKEQIVFFYDEKNISTDDDIKNNLKVIVRELVWSVDNGLVEIIDESKEGKERIFHLTVKDLMSQLGFKRTINHKIPGK